MVLQPRIYGVKELRLAAAACSILGLCAALSCADDGPPRSVTMTIGPTGGEIVLGRVTVTLPEGALTKDSEITLERSSAKLSKGSFEQVGDLFAFTPEDLELRVPARFEFSAADDDPEAPAVLFTQDRRTVAGLGLRAYTHELGRFALAKAGDAGVRLVAPMLASTPADASSSSHTDELPFRFELTGLAALRIVLTAYDSHGEYEEDLNGERGHDCAFRTEDVRGGSLSKTCSPGPGTATVDVTTNVVEFNAVPFLAPKLPTPVEVSVIAGGGTEDDDEPALALGFFAFSTSPCYLETCSGHGMCDLASGAPVCLCDDGFAPKDLECECVPRCEGRRCGGDGCNGSCEPGCSDTEQCDYNSGQCMPRPSGP